MSRKSRKNTTFRWILFFSFFSCCFRIQQVSLGILLKDKKLGNIIKKATTINDALKKAARFLHESASIDDYCLCLDNVILEQKHIISFTAKGNNIL